MEFAIGDFAAAAADLKARPENSSDPNRVLLEYFSLERLGQDGWASLQRDFPARESLWGPRIAGLIGGSSSEAEVLNETYSPEARCLVNLYLGEWHLQRHEFDKAAQSFRKAPGCPVDSVATVIGRAELQRLESEVK